MVANVTGLIKELDWDHSGKISYPEFLIGTQGWIMECLLDVNDDEDEDVDQDVQV